MDGQNDEAGGDGEPPSKRRRVVETTPNPKQKPKDKPPSPPWKQIKAEGLSSFTQDGKRKSGRTNHVPLELQPPSDKRQTRGAVQKEYSKGKHGIANAHTPSFQARDAPSASVNGTKRPGSSSTTAQHPPKSPAKPASPKRSHHRKSMPSERTVTPVRSHKKSSTPKNPQSAPAQARTSKGRRSGRVQETLDDEGLNEEYRPFTLWLHGYSCYQIDKHESGENITIPCADLTPPELLHLGRSIMKVLDEYGVDL